MKLTKSKKPGKKRRELYTTPNHKRRKMLASTLSDELRKKYNRRNLAVRKGDKVKIMRGEHKGTQGEVLKLDTTEYQIYVEGVTIKKTSGEEVPLGVHPSNVRITSLYMEDKERRALLNRTQPASTPSKKEDAKNINTKK